MAARTEKPKIGLNNSLMKRCQNEPGQIVSLPVEKPADVIRLEHQTTPRQRKEQTKTMSTRMDYEQIAAKLDYAALEKKLAQLAEREPPKKRKTAGDIWSRCANGCWR